MQYKGYELQITQSGVTIRNSLGTMIAEVCDEEEAYEYIDEGIDTHKEFYKNWNESFDTFCRAKRLQMQYLDGETYFCTYNEKRLRNLIDEFETKTGVKMTYRHIYRGGEQFCQICDCCA